MALVVARAPGVASPQSLNPTGFIGKGRLFIAFQKGIDRKKKVFIITRTYILTESASMLLYYFILCYYVILRYILLCIIRNKKSLSVIA